ncbi:MAG: universal stress protein [Pyrinomonadaceae bacterium]
MIRRILFPTDFSAVANSAFPFAAMLAEACSATITALHVSTSETRGAMGSEDDFPEHDPSTLRMERAIVSKAETESYAEVIIRKARLQKCDLILMASHGRSDVAQFFLGRSVAEQVVRDSPTPRGSGAALWIQALRPPCRAHPACDLRHRPHGAIARCAPDHTRYRAGHESTARLCFARLPKVIFNLLTAVAAQPEKLIADANLTDLVDSINTVHGGIAESIVEQAAENNVGSRGRHPQLYAAAAVTR